LDFLAKEDGLHNEEVEDKYQEVTIDLEVEGNSLLEVEYL